MMTPAQRSRCMSRIRSRDTKPERALRSALFRRGLRFRTRLGLTGRPDIVFTRARIAVFVDGCFWHGCPVHGTSPKSNPAYWTGKLARNRERDASVTSALEAGGWRVARYWEHDVRNDLARVVGEIEALWKAALTGLQNRTPAHTPLDIAGSAGYASGPGLRQSDNSRG